MACTLRFKTVQRLLAGLILLLTQDVLGAEPPNAVVTNQAGQSIYRDGLLASGLPVRATVQKRVALSGADAACVKCHRRSGLGGSEGQTTIRPIAGRLLFSPAPTGRPPQRGLPASSAAARPAYTLATLARALREGIDPGGRVLDALMPRYVLSDEDVSQLYAYLNGLSSAVAPGVTDSEIHFSTIITPEVRPDKRNAMLNVLQGYFSDKNGGTRKETRRREIGHEQMYRAYRTWVLHPWELTGPPETWGEQLATHYRQQPVFAVVGGIGDSTWQPLHDFCEAFDVPCVFPDVDYPELTGNAYYPLYFSRGVALEAEVLAKHLLETDPPGNPGAVVQIYRDNALGHLPAKILRAALQRRGGKTVTDYALADTGRMPADWLAKLPGNQGPTMLVFWLDASEIQTLELSGAPPAGLTQIYVSASLMDMRPPNLPEHWSGKLHMVYPFDLPARRELRLVRMKAWLRARNIPLADERTQANAYFAATVTADAIAYLGENFSRDYFIERIEEMTQTALSPSIYPHLSLGPGQRFASKGAYIVIFPGGTGGAPTAVSDWLIAEPTLPASHHSIY